MTGTVGKRGFGEPRRPVLIYDSDCGRCSEIATKIQGASRRRVALLSIGSREAEELLRLAMPTGWRRAPYLVTFRDDHVRAETGLWLAVRLVPLLGPAASLAVWKELRRPPAATSTGDGVPRREFIKLAGAFAILLSLLRVRGVQTASACLGCCGDVYCVLSSTFCVSPQYDCSPYLCNNADLLRIYNCYDNCCGNYCFQRVYRDYCSPDCYTC